jgi:uncharacterized protein YjbI with pentapeptide repeats
VTTFNTERERTEHAQQIYEGLVVEDTDLSKIDLSNCQLLHCTFRRVTLHDAKFDNIHILGGVFEEVDATGAMMVEATIDGCTVFKDVTLDRADLTRAKLHNLKPEQVSLRGTITTDVDYQRVDVASLYSTPPLKRG